MLTASTASYLPVDTSDTLLQTTAGGILRAAATRAGSTLALVEGSPDPAARRQWTYTELLAEAEQVARALLARFDPGERVAVWANNIPEWVLLEFGAALAGLTLVTVNPSYRASELTFVLKQSRASGIFLVPEYRGQRLADILDQARSGLPDLREVVPFSEWAAFCATGSANQPLPSVQPDDAAQIQYTSGTTGFPKGAVLHHRGITNSARFWAQRQGVAAGDVLVNPMPLFHTAGCVMLTLGAVQTLATHVLLPSFDPGLQLELIEAERGTLLVGVPTMLIALLEHPDFARRDLSSLRSAVAGGATVAPELVRRVETALNIPLSIVFAQTEASPFIAQTRLDDMPEDRPSRSANPYQGPRSRSSIPAAATQSRAVSSASCASAATTSCTATSTIPRAPRPPSTLRAGCTRATCARWTSVATATSRAGSRT
jgi:fatty-acyl-CoA synthase